jgi:hypothetical protein
MRQIPKVIAGPRADEAGGDQMGTRVTDDRQFGPGTTMIGASLGAADKVRTRMPCFQARGVQRPLRRFPQQMQGPGAAKNGIEESIKRPFFPSRFSA